jgi:Flp pilus assembly protein TadB
MNALSIRKLFLIVICLLAASVLIDFAHMVLSMIIDSVLAVAIVYFLWRMKGQYEKRIKELEAEVSVLHGCTRLSQAEANQFNELVCK